MRLPIKHAIKMHSQVFVGDLLDDLTIYGDGDMVSNFLFYIHIDA